jgi:predicted O-linked N-acetylglucosamine transferase (SPINDLY family)
VNASGLPELVARSIDEYAEKLSALASNPGRLRDYAVFLRDTRGTNPLFDTQGFAHDWEALLLQVYDEAGARQL